MKWLLWFTTTVLLVNLQQYPFAQWDIYGAVPCLLFTWALFAGLHFKFHEAFICAWAAGFALDLFCGFDFHIQSLLLPAFIVPVSWTRDSLFKHHPLTQIELAGLGYALYAYGYLTLVKLVYFPELPLTHYAILHLGCALYTALLTPLVFMGLRRVCRICRMQLENSIVAGAE